MGGSCVHHLTLRWRVMCCGSARVDGKTRRRVGLEPRADCVGFAKLTSKTTAGRRDALNGPSTLLVHG